MAETKLTKEIKKSIRNYNPLMKSNMRTIRWAEEVYVGTGYVDSIRFEDYIESTETGIGCKAIRPLKSYCERTVCSNCYMWGKRTIKNLGIAVTCYEIKISKSDFKSVHGHNFVGNFNYYVVPKDLYPKIKELVPEGIGVILYYGHGYLRIRKKSSFREVSKEDLSNHLYSALKKWVDQSYALQNEKSMVCEEWER